MDSFKLFQQRFHGHLVNLVKKTLSFVSEKATEICENKVPVLKLLLYLNI